MKQKNSIPGQLFWVLVSFLCGYLTATAFDFASLKTWVNSTVLAKSVEEKPKAQVAAKPVEQPKPKFEFYTLLAKDRKTSVATTTAATKPSPVAQQANAVKPAIDAAHNMQPAALAIGASKPLIPVSNRKEAYQIQIAAFKHRQDAEHMKAVLTLKGFDVSIAATTQQPDWYRVMVGPFNSREAAEKTQMVLAKSERIKGMIRKMEG